jgi:hypothetical protein
MLIVLLTVGGVGLAKAPSSEEEVGLDEGLVWADVQRQFERADRRTSGQALGATTIPPLFGTPDPHPSSGELPNRDGPES